MLDSARVILQSSLSSLLAKLDCVANYNQDINALTDLLFCRYRLQDFTHKVSILIRYKNYGKISYALHLFWVMVSLW